MALPEGVAYLSRDIDSDTKVLELGPGYNPTLRKSQGWNVHSLDHATKADLESKYSKWQVEASSIEEVDFIWKGGAMHEAIPKEHHGTYERIIASNFIEHMIDLIGFFRSALILLAPTGKLVVAVPDKRYCFDFFRSSTLTSDLIESNLGDTRRHNFKVAFETYFYHCQSGSSIAWRDRPPGSMNFTHGLRTAMEMVDAYKHADPSDFVDMHASVFTPGSFELIILELGALGLADMCLLDLTENGTHEFYAALGKSAAQIRNRGGMWVQSDRLRLLTKMLDETTTQFGLLANNNKG